MSNRLAVVVLALLVALVFTAPAFAAVQNTAHDQPSANQGVCSSCHIPHKALGARLWPQDMSGQAGALGTVGSLCYYCHGSGGGAGIANAVQVLVTAVGAGEAGEFAHGRDTVTAPPGGDTIATSGLPYAGNALIECTSCHNVHDDTNAPFLQVDIDTLCANCHSSRQFVGGADSNLAGNWGAAFYGDANPGSHPVGLDILGDDSDTGNSPIDLTIGGVFASAYGGTEAHNLGGHLTNGDAINTGGVGCVTCHAVHGLQADADPPSGGTAAQVNLLAIDQPTAGGMFGGSVRNGNGDPRNALCEGCHTEGLAGTIDASTGVAYGGALEPNPGGTAYTHPVDDLGASGTASVAAFPAGWPTGSAPGTSVLPGPICESCHTPHPAANIPEASRTDMLATAGSHILRSSESDASAEYLCLQCHSFGAEGAGHHPVGAGLMGGRMADALIGDQDNDLTCGDCHAAGGGAHNWQGAGVGLDPDWEPAGNGRGTPAQERSTTNLSKECEDCHFDSGAHESPTNNAGTGVTTPVSHAYRAWASPNYMDIGDASHYLGETTMDYSLGSLGGSSFNASTTAWPGGGWSRFGDRSANEISCESCHELEADKNVANTALLLSFYQDGSTDAAADPSGLCEGCHGTSPGGSGTPHPMTGDTVSRTGSALVTVSPYVRSTVDVTTESRATFPAVNGMNCDSCHQPHDADTEGGTYIYDSGEGITPASAIEHDVTNDGSAVGDGRVPYPNTRGVDIGVISDENFCDSCHWYTD